MEHLFIHLLITSQKVFCFGHSLSQGFLSTDLYIHSDLSPYSDLRFNILLTNVSKTISPIIPIQFFSWHFIGKPSHYIYGFIFFSVAISYLRIEFCLLFYPQCLECLIHRIFLELIEECNLRWTMKMSSSLGVSRKRKDKLFYSS